MLVFCWCCLGGKGKLGGMKGTFFFLLMHEILLAMMMLMLLFGKCTSTRDGTLLLVMWHSIQCVFTRRKSFFYPIFYVIRNIPSCISLWSGKYPICRGVNAKDLFFASVRKRKKIHVESEWFAVFGVASHPQGTKHNVYGMWKRIQWKRETQWMLL